MSKTIAIKGCKTSHLNGLYYPCNSSFLIIDQNTTLYKKDATHQIYRYHGEWRIANIGKHVYQTLIKNNSQNFTHNVIDFRDTETQFELSSEISDNHEPTINFGVFVYGNRYKRQESFNLGDWVQSLAALNIYKKIVEAINGIEYDIETFTQHSVLNKIPGFNFVFINRDNMDEISQYQGLHNIITIMNGWWMHPVDGGNIAFTIPPNVIPIFVSFHIANDKLLRPENIDIFKRYEPIGCRDKKTMEKLKKKGVKSYFSGCLTTTIDFMRWNNRTDNVYVVDTKISKKDLTTGIGIKYEDLASKNNIDYSIHYPDLSKTKIIKMSHNNRNYQGSGTRGLEMALGVLKQYSESNGVLTSRLHGYLPCLAMGVPAEFISPNGRTKSTTWGSPDRFDGLRELRDKNKFNRVRRDLTSLVTGRVVDQLNILFTNDAIGNIYTPSRELVIKGFNDIESLSKSHTIPICFCSDSNLVDHIPTVLESIRVKNYHHTLKIYYIHNIQDRSKLEKLIRYVDSQHNMTLVDIYQTWDGSYKGLSHVSSATMLRLFIPEQIPEHILIYLDIDIIVNMDLSNLMDVDTGDKGLAIKSSISSTWKNMAGASKAGNVGVMVMNLDKLRQLNFTAECLSIHEKNDDRHDQWIINKWAQGKYIDLPANCNVFYRQDDWLLDQHHEYILHYAGGSKPYFRNTGPLQYKWDVNVL